MWCRVYIHTAKCKRGCKLIGTRCCVHVHAEDWRKWVADGSLGPSFPSHARRIPLLRVCCCAPDGKKISVNYGTAGAQQQQRHSTALSSKSSLMLPYEINRYYYNASSVTFTAVVGSWTETCIDLIIIIISLIRTNAAWTQIKHTQ